MDSKHVVFVGEHAYETLFCEFLTIFQNHGWKTDFVTSIEAAQKLGHVDLLIVWGFKDYYCEEYVFWTAATRPPAIWYVFTKYTADLAPAISKVVYSDTSPAQIFSLALQLQP